MRSMPAHFLLDAWAILAMLQREEPAATRVRRLVADATEGHVRLAMSVINLGEVFYSVGRLHGLAAASETLAMIRGLPIQWLSASDHRVFVAAQYKVRHRLSYADAFAAAATEELGATLVTGDPELVALAGTLQVERLVRQTR